MIQKGFKDTVTQHFESELETIELSTELIMKKKE